MDTIEEIIALSKDGLRKFDAAKDPSAVYLPDDARAIVCYFPGDGGEEVTAWLNGQKIAAAPIEVIGSIKTGFGYVCFDIPDGATMKTSDPRGRRVFFM